MIRAFTVFISLSLFSIPALAQKETSFWIDRFYSFDFNSYPPKTVNLTASSLYQNGRATIADTAGNLLFYSDGFTYYDRHGNPMPNGKVMSPPDFGTTFLPFVIAPRPGSKTQYYLFTVRLPDNSSAGFDYTLRYSIVDIALNGGYGDVVEENVEISQYIRDEFTLMKTPEDTTGFWLIGVNIHEAETLLAYRVTGEGISMAPVKTYTGAFIDQSLFKASPDGQYLAIRSTPVASASEWVGTHRLKIFKFDGITGTFTLFRQIITLAPVNSNAYPQTHVWVANPEFSSDSRFLYVVKDSTFSPEINQFRSFQSIHCYDMHASTNEEFLNSRQILHTYPEIGFPIETRMQLTPQRKIIVGDLTESGYFSTIHSPKECDVEAKRFELNSIRLNDDFFHAPPVFPSWYFYEPPPLHEERFAGNDALVCPNQSVTLGENPAPGFHYFWQPAPGLSNIHSANAVFVAPLNTSGVNDSTRLHVKIVDTTGCSHYDSVQVVTKSVRNWNINGSRSVCPGVEEVKYWIENNWNGESIDWQVTGGVIVQGNQTDTVLVDWGVSNPNASVMAFSENKNGCHDEVQPFPVKVFKVLDTEMPGGRDTLLCGLYTENYKILPTNGSVYHWQIINGNILDGQGTQQTLVEWDSTTLYGHLWINESVNTELEICFGRSDTLHVVNPSQMLSQNLHLNNISGTVFSNDTIVIDYDVRHPVFYEPDVLLQRRGENGMWQTVGLTKSSQNSASFGGQPLDENAFQFRLLALNYCGDSAVSEIHKNVFLTMEKRIEENDLRLSWNHYAGWTTDQPDYEIFRLLDDDSQFMMTGQTSDSAFVSGYNTDGFVHTYYVVAISPGGEYRSVSNKVTREFENALVLPNVITPNGDNKNDFWKPYPLELYSENQLIIFNRWGEEVYRALNYTGYWDGDGLSSGMYFYYFKARKNDQPFANYKGLIQIIK